MSDSGSVRADGASESQGASGAFPPPCFASPLLLYQLSVHPDNHLKLRLLVLPPPPSVASYELLAGGLRTERRMVSVLLPAERL